MMKTLTMQAPLMYPHKSRQITVQLMNALMEVQFLPWGDPGNGLDKGTGLTSEEAELWEG